MKDCDIKLKPANNISCKNVPKIDKKFKIDFLGNVTDEFNNFIGKLILKNN